MREYPKLGTEVKFIRQDVQNSCLVEGIGEVQGIFYDPRKMPMVRVKVGDEAFNIDLVAVNPEEGFKEAYESMLEEVKVLTKEGNDKAQAIVKEYNEKIDAIYSEFLK